MNSDDLKRAVSRAENDYDGSVEAVERVFKALHESELPRPEDLLMFEGALYSLKHPNEGSGRLGYALFEAISNYY